MNVTTTGSIATSLGIAIGNTIEGRLGADLVRLFANGRDVFNRARDVVKFVVLGALFSTTVSAHDRGQQPDRRRSRQLARVPRDLVHVVAR